MRSSDKSSTRMSCCYTHILIITLISDECLNLICWMVSSLSNFIRSISALSLELLQTNISALTIYYNYFQGLWSTLKSGGGEGEWRTKIGKYKRVVWEKRKAPQSLQSLKLHHMWPVNSGIHNYISNLWPKL